MCHTPEDPDLPAGASRPPRYAQRAVFLPLVEGEGGQPHLIFEVRAARLKELPQETCFPGIRVEPGDASAMEAAVREACEELGLPPAAVEVWNELDIMVTPFQFLIIYPFVGSILGPGLIRADSREVPELFTLPVGALLKVTPSYYPVQIRGEPSPDFPLHKIPRGENHI